MQIAVRGGVQLFRPRRKLLPCPADAAAPAAVRAARCARGGSEASDHVTCAHITCLAPGKIARGSHREFRGRSVALSTRMVPSVEETVQKGTTGPEHTWDGRVGPVCDMVRRTWDTSFSHRAHGVPRPVRPAVGALTTVLDHPNADPSTYHYRLHERCRLDSRT